MRPTRSDRRNFLGETLTWASAAATSAGVLGLPTRAAEAGPQLGAGASLGGKRLFPEHNPWNQEVSAKPADPRSDVLIASIGPERPLHPDFGTVYQGAPSGIPYI